MAAFKNIGLKEYFKRYGYKYGLKRMAFLANPFHYVGDYESKKILYYSKISKKFDNKFLKYSSCEPEGLNFGNTVSVSPDTVWIYWKQGISNAPQIVKKCIESIKRNVNLPIIILTDQNLSKYLKLPNYVERKNSLEKMSNAALSDLIRLSLLEHYGGTWIDATVFLTGPLPEYITKSDFFAFQDSFGLINNPALYSNWLLHCKKHNILIKETRNISFKYWEKEIYVREYLWEYIVMTLIINKHSEYLKKIPYAISDYSQLLLKELNNKVDISRLTHIFNLTNIHKLSYKLSSQTLEDPQNVYNYILNNKLEDIM